MAKEQGKEKDVYAEFYRMPVNWRELKEDPFPGDRWKVQVERVVELTQDDFEEFRENLCEYRRFIETHGQCAYFDEEENCAHCLLVTTSEQKEGILVEAEGFSYARYAAYIPDSRVLELTETEAEKEGELAYKVYTLKSNMAAEQKIKNARFYFRMANLVNLKECPVDREPESFQIIRRFCLPRWKFMEFASDLARRNPWLNRPDAKAFYYEIGEPRKCAAVTTDDSREAILVDTQGYDYARICAYIPDYRRLELSGVSVTYYNGIKAVDEKSPYIETAVFYRGANTLYGFENQNPHSHEDSFQIEKQVVLTDSDYMEFATNMKEDYEFLFSNHSSMYFEPDRQCWHCLFVTGEHAPGGILVDSEGYAHAEYSALIPYKKKLNLSGIPIESHLPDAHRKEQIPGDQETKESHKGREGER